MERYLLPPSLQFRYTRVEERQRTSCTHTHTALNRGASISGVRYALELQVLLVQVGGNKLLCDATEETLACEIGPQGGERERRGVGEEL